MSEDCKQCEREHEAHKRGHEAMELPISSIRDGWVLHDGDLYLTVEVAPNTTTMIRVPRYTTGGRRKRTRDQ